MPQAHVQDRIEKAAGDGRLIRLTRRRGWDRLDGSIVARSRKWLLLALELDAGFDGHALVRVSDVRRLERSPNAAFVERALAVEGHWPLPGLEGVELASTRAALRTLADSVGLVSIGYEQDHPDECLIGLPRHFGQKKFRLQTVNPAAEWDTEDATFRYRSVSRIDVGGSYERRLSAVAGPPPP